MVGALGGDKGAPQRKGTLQFGDRKVPVRALQDVDLRNEWPARRQLSPSRAEEPGSKLLRG